MLQIFRNHPRFHAEVCKLLGISLLIVALLVQAPFWLSARYQKRMQSWRIVLPIDFSATNTYKENFQPTGTLMGNPQFRMRGPLLTEFQETDLGGAYVPPHILQESFSNSTIDFELSWKILEEGKILDSGVFGPHDVNAWSYPFHVYYKAEDHSGYRQLNREKVYSLVVEVTEPGQAVNKFKPTFILGPPSGKNFISLSNRFLILTIPLFILGIVLLVIFAWTYKSMNKERQF